MKSTIKKMYVCSNCDAQSIKWNGRCLECGAWGTMKEQIIDAKIDNQKKNNSLLQADLIDLSEVGDIETDARIKTNISEVDRVLGGGIVPGSIILLSGEPGAGKSTIIAQIADRVASYENASVIYASGEESASQVKNRLLRLNCQIKNFKFLSETNVEKIIATAKNTKPTLLIIDSIQTVYSQNVETEAGGVSQIRASAVSFLELAKKHNIATILIGHITKDGQLAGPKSLEHIVDTVIYLEADKAGLYRILRSTKNRFGSVNEIGIFEMTGKGFVEIINPSQVFIDSSAKKISGSVVSCIIEGSRPFLVEIQALVSKTVFGYPQRKASGFDLNRLQVLSSVLSKKAGINLANQDVILNVVGGMKINDPALDLAVCASIISSLLDKTINSQIVVFGEVGLGGEIRTIFRLKERLNEMVKLGFKTAITPDIKDVFENLEIIKMNNLRDFVTYLKK